MINKVPLHEIDNKFPEGIALYIGMASFEDRCISTLKALKHTPKHCLFFKNIAAGNLAEKNLNRMVGLVAERNTVIGLDLDSPITAADAFTKAMTENITLSSEGTVFIDSTTFTHEQLLILLRVLDQSRPKGKIYMGYIGAERYSTNTDIENVWLSRGVSQIRTVLGYPGSFAPSKKLHLTILVGFEHERAAAVIEQFEPARLTLMCGDPGKSVSAGHYDTNKRFFEELKNFVERTQFTQTAVETLYFSCIDPFSTRDTVLQIATQSSDYNIVVCPMNTKLSTIGVGLAALKDERIQIAYARAIEYNEAGYSTPSAMATIFEYP
ncbi:MAG TPA: hypothetical protein VMW10_05725 [Alphaproteobacteria bacterium]|nr:hypothetical protein [Alphaproteobacteria bacterium]